MSTLALVSSQSREQLRGSLIADLRRAARGLARLDRITVVEVFQAAAHAEASVDAGAGEARPDAEVSPW